MVELGCQGDTKDVAVTTVVLPQLSPTLEL